MYKNILIATDGSDLAKKGLDHGLTLAKGLGVPVTIMTTTEMWSSLNMANEAAAHLAEPITKYEKAEAEVAKRVLEAAEKTAAEKGVKCECVHIRDQHPAEGIIHTAHEKDCDLIVMASHGRRGIQRTLLGSVTSEVLSHTRIPVLVVR